jgi:hypothetical protein
MQGTLHPVNQTSSVLYLHNFVKFVNKWVNLYLKPVALVITDARLISGGGE